MSNFAILSDSACDLPDFLKKKYEITIIPFYVSFDRENYLKENVDISIEQFYEKISNKNIIPTTSLPSVQDYIDVFTPILKASRDILCFTISSKLSGSYQSAFNASNILKEEFPNRVIKIVDSKRATIAQSLLILEGAKMRNSGYSIEKCYEKILEITMDGVVAFTINSLDYLERGGRIGKAIVLASSLLNIKPILLLKDGVLEPHSKVRGRKRALRELLIICKQTIGDNPFTDYQIAIAHSNCLEEAIEFEQELFETLGLKLDYPIFQIGATIGCHTGDSVIGIGIMKKYNKK